MYVNKLIIIILNQQAPFVHNIIFTDIQKRTIEQMSDNVITEKSRRTKKKKSRSNKVALVEKKNHY